MVMVMMHCRQKQRCRGKPWGDEVMTLHHVRAAAGLHFRRIVPAMVSPRKRVLMGTIPPTLLCPCYAVSGPQVPDGPYLC
eukprot:3761969-Rhodomonas_salina.2